MNFSKISAAILVAIAPVVAHAQLNQLLGVIHSVQNAVTQPAQGQPQQPGQDTAQDDQRLVVQAQAQQAGMQQQAQQQEQQNNAAYRAQMEQRAAAGRQQAQRMVADQDAKDIAAYKASQQRGQQEAQQQLDAARKMIGICPDLANAKYNRAEQFIRCRNRGMSEEQEMTYVGGFPLLAQAYLSSMVQDVYEDNVTEPGRGKAITDYYVACADRGTPCARPKW
ncbi:hypothetical protein [Burkholderia sp. BE17]|uniref:hypothetical protein n=1 Tax=Burkholderia sp. BE17 TaxID=2656644 RepID=UPI00128B4078|nr:hypothetical protein [Burkholderia sp. BE17]MPV64378.1 hypothetical protein [Burkholderia sp. BE17]